MIETVEITIDNKTYKYSKNITLQEIYMEHQGTHKFPIILARVNNKLKELSYEIKDNCTVEFLDLTTKEANKAHVNGLIFVMLYAIKRLYGKDANMIVQHSLDKGVYIETSFKLTEDKVNAIREEMIQIMENDLPITRLTIDRLEAIKYFNSIGDTAKAGVLNYNTDNYITLYRLGNIYNYFYSLMPPSTGKLKLFDLTYIKGNGLALRFPTIYVYDEIKPYTHHPLLFDVFKEYKDWAKLIGVRNSVELNKELAAAKNRNDLSFIEVKCSIGARDDLGRPTTTALENKINFMGYLSEF